MDKKAKAHFEAVVSYASDHSSEQERAADVAEREVDDYYKAVYMEKRIGQEYDGTVSGVTNFGIFVELPSSVEGLVRLADMGDDYYNYDEENFCVLGERTKKMYKIGDSVRILKSMESEYLKNRLKISKFDVSEFGIDEEFDERIIKEACRLSDERIEYEINKRVDLRDLKTFTIDGKNSKDLDDAISINKNFNGNYILGKNFYNRWKKF